MTEQEWLLGTKDPIFPTLMVGQVKGTSDRKLRLLGCAFCRELWSRLSAIDRRAVEIGEGLADGIPDIGTQSWRHRRRAQQQSSDRTALVASMVERCVGECGWYAAELNVGSGLIPQARECAIIRGVFGNPFQPITIEQALLDWRDGVISKIAKHIYDERSFAELPILADAVEEAGCTNTELLKHLRHPGPHVRGCWALDLLLGRN